MFSDNQNGFTLIELLVSIAIVAILAGMSIVMFSEYRARSYDTIAIAQARDAYSALNNAYADREVPFPCNFTIRNNDSVSYGGGSNTRSACLPGFVHAADTMVSISAYEASLTGNEMYVVACHKHGSKTSANKRYFFYIVSTNGKLQQVTEDFTMHNNPSTLASQNFPSVCSE